MQPTAVAAGVVVVFMCPGAVVGRHLRPWRKCAAGLEWSAAILAGVLRGWSWGGWRTYQPVTIFNTQWGPDPPGSVVGAAPPARSPALTRLQRMCNPQRTQATPGRSHPQVPIGPTRASTATLLSTAEQQGVAGGGIRNARTGGTPPHHATQKRAWVYPGSISRRRRGEARGEGGLCPAVLG